jgi:hypothetical protein
MGSHALYSTAVKALIETSIQREAFVALTALCKTSNVTSRFLLMNQTVVICRRHLNYLRVIPKLTD